MNINLTGKVTEAISILQQSPEMISMITDAEEFIIEHMDNEDLLAQAMSNIKGLLMVRRLLEDIIKE